jgi:hypothetical protein
MRCSHQLSTQFYSCDWGETKYQTLKRDRWTLHRALHFPEFFGANVDTDCLLSSHWGCKSLLDLSNLLILPTL